MPESIPVPSSPLSSLVERWRAMSPAERETLLATLSPQAAEVLLRDWRGLWARPEQLPPPGDGWATWLILAGRGFGKSRAGAEWVRAQVEDHGCQRVALVARTAADARDVMVEGESGILAISPSWNRPLYEPSKRRLTWPNGAIATLYSAEEPDLLRGPQHDAAWADEIATWLRAQETWDNLTLTLRLGARPRAVVTTTPRPIPIVRSLLQSPTTVTTRGSTFDNADNLPASVLAEFRARWIGTRIGAQELYGHLLTDTPGAIFSRDLIDKYRVRVAPELMRVAIGVDPAVTAGPDSDLTGIVVAGRAADGRLYVLEDASLRGSPDQWARRVVVMFDKHEADVIVIETNQGGELLSNLLNSVRQGLPIQTQHAKRGKMLRAEGPAAFYEQGKVAHVSPPELREEPLAALEEEMCSWTPGSSDSPDRLDALVYALLELSAPLPGAGLLEFYKLEAAKVLAAKGRASGRQSLVAPTWRKRQVDPWE